MMTEHALTPLEIRLDAPEANLESLSFAEGTASDIFEWVSALPLANTTETAAQLKLATAELALYNAPAQSKYDCLEAVRPAVHYVCSRLDRTNKTMAAPASADLLLNLCTGYKAIVLALLPQHPGNKLANKDVLQKAIHRVLADLSRVLLRSLQRYVQPPQDFWWEVNELYRLAELLELQEFRLKDNENNSDIEMSIETTYLRSVLLASCKSNQLLQHQINSVFSALEQWCSYVELRDDRKQSLLVIDLLANRGPQYTQLANNLSEPRELRTEVLAYEIEAYLKEVATKIQIPESMSTNLLYHLAEAWTIMKQRTFKRMKTDTLLRVCVGLRATHYFLSGRIEFGDQITNSDSLMRREVNPFLDLDYEPSAGSEDDPWSQAHDLKVAIPQNPNITDPDMLLVGESVEPSAQRVSGYKHYETHASDTSPGGYQIRWVGTPPDTAVGEVFALREEKDTRWCVAVVRWIRQQSGANSMGVELLAPRAIPVAIRVIQTKGGPTDYARGLLLPEIKAIRQPATLITPSLPFAAGQKINVQRQGLQTTAQLLESRIKTESFNQFTFRMLDGYLEN